MEEYDPFAPEEVHSGPAAPPPPTAAAPPAAAPYPQLSAVQHSGREWCDPHKPQASSGQQQQQQRSGTATGAGSPTRHGADPGATAAADEELDQLLESYDQQARAEVEQLAAMQAPKRSRKAADVREAGLSTPLDTQNKGYQLLAKLGYQPGQGVGRQRQGPAEPLPLVMRTRRAGLGVDEQQAQAKRQQEEEAMLEAAKRRKMAEQQQQSFRQAAAGAFRLRQLKGQLAAALKAARSLDEGAGVADNPLLDPLEAALNMQQAEGGEAGGLDAACSDGAAAAEEQQEGPDLGSLEGAAASLMAVLEYVRGRYCYCLYCGCTYEDAADLAANCPGCTQEEHD